METFTCPHCGGKTDYDPNQAGREMRVERQDGKSWWAVYCRVRCAHCGQEGLDLRERTELP